MSAVPKKKLTAAEYLAIERDAEFKSDFYNGEMFARAGASRDHNRVKENLIGEIGGRLTGKPCRTYSSDQRVSAAASGLYTYPDIVVVCGREEFDPLDRHTMTNPTALIEVLSPSTENYDRVQKFRLFQPLASLREYVLVSQDEMRVECFVRQENGSWLLTVYDDPAGDFELAAGG